jgi:site-specific recombinase XerD
MKWLEVCRGRLRPKTFDSYVLCAHRVELQLGRVPLSRLNPMIIQSAYARLQAGGLSPRTVFQTHAVLHRVHDLRHTTATVLLEAGAHPKLVQDLLGHSTVALTLNTYSHVTSGLSREAARTMDAVLRPV